MGTRPPSPPGVVGALLVGALLVAAVPAIPAVATEPCEEPARARFSDVGDDSLYADSVDCLVWRSLAQGVSYHRFGPQEAVTRGQLASFLDRAIAVTGEPLPDPDVDRFVDAGEAHGPAIERLAAAGIVEGRTAEWFVPDAPVRRDQLASMLVAAYEVQVGAVVDGGTPAFTDVAGNLHEPAIAAATALGLLAGTSPQTYDPAGSASRGQVALVLQRLLARVVANRAGVRGLTPPTGHVARTRAVPPGLRVDMERWTWAPGCPVPIADLRFVEVVHRDLSDTDRWGALVVHRDVADEVAAAFGALYAEGFRIARMAPIERYRGDDAASMAANNTSAFNCRAVTGGSTWSEHSYGRAIDINPVQNPYVRGSLVLPADGAAFLDREDVRPGMLVRPGAVEVFDALGWGWGGDFESLKDYQHLSRSGR